MKGIASLGAPPKLLTVEDMYEGTGETVMLLNVIYRELVVVLNMVAIHHYVRAKRNVKRKENANGEGEGEEVARVPPVSLNSLKKRGEKLSMVQNGSVNVVGAGAMKDGYQVIKITPLHCWARH